MATGLETLHIRTTPLISGPIVSPSDSAIDQAGSAAEHPNINGPSLIRVPDWVVRPLARYYLYFADHKGDRIHLALSDDLAGPWSNHEPGTLHLRDTPFLQSPPEIPADVDRDALAMPRAEDVPSVLDDCIIPHIASREVIVDDASRSIRLYYHGLDAFARQVSRVAVSRDGLDFEARPEILAPPYLRMFHYRANGYGLAMPGGLFRSESGLTDFETGPVLFEPEMRHAGLWLRGEELWVFWTRVGDAPERILLSTIDLSHDWKQWRASEPVEVRRAIEDWEGAALPPMPSVRSAINRPANQLRDPFLFEDEGRCFLVYAVAGEAGLGIARFEFAWSATL
jgi:hypothetical protein